MVAILLAMVVCTVLGITIEGLAYRPLRQATSLAVLITAIGMSYLLQNLALLIWGANPKSFPSSTMIGLDTISLFGGRLTISGVTLVAALICGKTATVINVGINRTAQGTLVGDVDFESVLPVAGAITPVPGGVGPMTIAMLMRNTIECYKNRL